MLQYSTLVLGDLRQRFPSVRRRVVPLNVPPAILFACSDGGAGADAGAAPATPTPK